MRAKGYGSYRGRSPFKKFLKILVVILIILIVLGAAAALYLQQYLVISNEGVRLELPFFQQEEPEPVTTPSEFPSEPPVVVVSPLPEPEPEPEALCPVSLPREALYDGTAVSQIETVGGDCALFDMKADSGELSYGSGQELAITAKLSADDPALNAAIKGLNETEGLYTVARVSCFKDHNITDYERSLSIFTNSDYRWTDPDGIRWISPTNPDVRDYLTAICVELAELGFDEILLDNAGYPSEGNLHYIKKGAAYDETQFASVIDGFYAQVSAALEEYDVKLSVVTTPEALAGLDSLTGQTPENLARFDRLWMRDETDALLPAESTP
ncbi:MAG: putative glycoside hydrolase [Oscillospiraceae bacterium]